jgi:hypothetical protein
LHPDEIEKMIDWSLHLAPVFPEATQRLCESGLSTIKYSQRFLLQLAASGYASRYPEAVAELLRYLLPHASRPFVRCEQAATLFRLVVQFGSVPHSVLDQISSELGALGCPNANELRELLG